MPLPDHRIALDWALSLDLLRLFVSCGINGVTGHGITLPTPPRPVSWPLPHRCLTLRSHAANSPHSTPFFVSCPRPVLILQYSFRVYPTSRRTTGAEDSIVYSEVVTGRGGQMRPIRAADGGVWVCAPRVNECDGSGVLRAQLTGCQCESYWLTCVDWLDLCPDPISRRGDRAGCRCVVVVCGM